MKLPKPLWNRALQVFFRQQIFLAKKNPWNSDYMRVSSEWWSCINRLSQRLAVFPHTALQLAVSISGQIDDTNLLQGASVIATEQDYSTLLPRYPQLPYWWLAFLWRLSFQNLVGFLALCNDPVRFAAVSSEILPSCPPSLKAVLLPACFHRFPPWFRLVFVFPVSDWFPVGVTIFSPCHNFPRFTVIWGLWLLPNVTSTGRSPHFLQLTFQTFRSQPLGRPSYRFIHHNNVTDDFQTSSWNRRLAALPCRIGFVILRTALSLPVALHPISQWRSYFPLRRYGLRRQGLSPWW